MIDFSKRILNTNKFRNPALHFQRHGVYCFAPPGTTEYLAYWDEEQERCSNGFTSDDGDWISGYNYFYLNYCPILRLVEFEYKDRFGAIKKRREKTREFPDFYDYDYYYFSAIQEAEDEGKHMVVLKKRGAGYSFKGASMLVRNYYHFAESKSYAIAAETEYLVRDGLLSKSWDLMDFIDEHTAWSKKRTITTKMHRRSGVKIKDEFGNETEIGYKSEIIGVTLKNDPNRARGKRGKLILWEEAGSFKDILQAWTIARPSVEEDGVAYGLMIAFGTGGDQESRFDGLKELFYNPNGYNVKSFSNIWDDNAEGNICAFFVPVYANMSVLDLDGTRLYMDKQGNSYVEKATEYALSERQKVIDGSSDSRAIDRYIAENPLTPQEAVLELSGNIFPKKDLINQLSQIRTNRKLQSHKQVGDLSWINGELIWQAKKTGDITKYPLGKDDKHDGSIVIWEHPMKEAPHGLYIAGCLTPGEKVLTNHGLKDVEKVDHGDLLVNENGENVKIKVFQKRYKENHDTYRITPYGSYRSTNFTEEHPILINNTPNNELIDSTKFELSKNLKTGDWLKIPNRYSTYNEDYVNTIYKYFGTDIDPNNNLLWWFIGVWLGDGFNNKNGNSHDIYTAFGINQSKSAVQFDYVISKLFNRKTIHCKSNGGNTRRFTHKILFEFLENEFGKYSHGKRLPEWAKLARNDLRKYMIAGYLDSDGSAFYDRGKLRVNFTSINLELLESIQDILFSTGISNTITRHSRKTISVFNNKEYISKESYRLSISRSSIKKIIPPGFDNILKSDKMRRIIDEKLSSVVKTGDKAVISSCGKYIYLPIVKIEKSKYTGTVYNFECDTHTYMCRNITSHNCDPLTI